jgi:hypothetical protein
MVSSIKNGWMRDMCEEAKASVSITTCLFENKGEGFGYTEEDDEREMKKSASCEFSPKLKIGTKVIGARNNQCYPIAKYGQLVPNEDYTENTALQIDTSTFPQGYVTGFYPKILEASRQVD